MFEVAGCIKMVGFDEERIEVTRRGAEGYKEKEGRLDG